MSDTTNNLRPVPKGFFEEIAEAVKGCWSLIVGLKVTGKNYLDSQLTVHYPRQTVTHDELEGYRGHIELTPSPKDPTKAKCIACNMCVRACPSNCITVKKKKVPKPPPPKEGEKPKRTPPSAESFHLKYHLCSLCGLCVQSCKPGAIRFSKHVYFAGGSRKDFEIDLIDRLRRQAAAGGAAKPAASADGEKCSSEKEDA